MPATSAAAKNPFLSLLKEVADRVDPRLAEVLLNSETLARTYGEGAGHMVAAVRHLCERGGKRLRPGLCVVGGLCVDPEFDSTPAIEAGISLELLQAYFLIHDDWMDQDETRRGGPTAHVELSKIFRSKGLGERSAILAGDHAAALATQHLATIPTTPARLKRCLARFSEMQLAAIAGQQLDILSAAKNPEQVYELKTASYTVRGPLLLGAELAGAGAKTIEALNAYSLPAGIAFQLRDDLVGVFGQANVTGKSQGGDLKEGKMTSLVQQARSRMKDSDRKKLDAVFGNRKATSAEVKAATKALDSCGAREAIEDRIAELMVEAKAHLEAGDLTKQGKKLLTGAIVALAQRAS